MFPVPDAPPFFECCNYDPVGSIPIPDIPDTGRHLLVLWEGRSTAMNVPPVPPEPDKPQNHLVSLRMRIDQRAETRYSAQICLTSGGSGDPTRTAKPIQAIMDSGDGLAAVIGYATAGEITDPKGHYRASGLVFIQNYTARDIVQVDQIQWQMAGMAAWGPQGFEQASWTGGGFYRRPDASPISHLDLLLDGGQFLRTKVEVHVIGQRRT